MVLAILIDLILIGIIGYGIYKLTPKVKEWWRERHTEQPAV